MKIESECTAGHRPLQVCSKDPALCTLVMLQDKKYEWRFDLFIEKYVLIWQKKITVFWLSVAAL